MTLKIKRFISSLCVVALVGAITANAVNSSNEGEFVTITVNSGELTVSSETSDETPDETPSDVPTDTDICTDPSDGSDTDTGASDTQLDTDSPYDTDTEHNPGYDVEIILEVISYINKIGNDIHCVTSASGYIGIAESIEVTQYLEAYIDGEWVNVRTWKTRVYDATCDIENVATGMGTGTYRLVSVVKMCSNFSSEEWEKLSNQVFVNKASIPFKTSEIIGAAENNEYVPLNGFGDTTKQPNTGANNSSYKLIALFAVCTAAAVNLRLPKKK